jgi:hypothetical protein
MSGLSVSCSKRSATSHNVSSIAWRVQVVMKGQMGTSGGQSNATG